MNFDDRLRAALAHDPAPAVPLGFVDGVVAALPQARRGPVQRLWPVRMAVAVVIVLVVGVWLTGSLGSLSGPPASATAGTATSPHGVTAPTSTTSPGLAAWTHLGWADVSGPLFAGSDVTVQGGLSWQGGYLLYGEDVVARPTGVFGLVWVSPDGRSWQRVPPDYGTSMQVVFGNAPIVGAAARGDTLVVVGQLAHATLGTAGIALWTSHDGLKWTEVIGAPSEFASVSSAGIVAGPHGFVVYGTSQPLGEPAHPTILYSEDGTAWTPVPVPNTVAGEAVTSVVATADGFAAVGGPATGAAGTGVPGAAWWSLDGQTWHPAIVDSGEPLYRVVRWADGELRASSSTRSSCSACLSADVTWSSTDGGRSWRPLGDSVVIPYGDTMLFDAGRVVRLQTQGSPRAMWSSDGLTWLPLRMDGTSPTTGSLLVVANRETLIATGMRPDGQGGSQTEVLVGQLDDQPGPVPTPTLVPGSQDTPCQGTNPCGP